MQEEFRLIEEMISYENKYNSQKYKEILADLQSNDDIRILEAVTRLSTELSMAEEISLGGFSLDSLIPELINCLTKDGIPDIMIHAAASLTHILDILPNASSVLVNNEGVAVLCEKVQYFEYSDVAENAIKALEKVSLDYGDAVLKCDGVAVLVNTIDFFVQSVQKNILNIIMNCIGFVGNEAILLQNILPNFQSLYVFLKNDGGKIDTLAEFLSKLCEKIVKIAGDEFEKKKKLLEIFISAEIIGKIFEILLLFTEEEIHKNLAKSCQILENCVKILNKICFCSADFCLLCFKLEINVQIEKILNIYLKLLGSKESSLFSNLLYETVLLVNSIISIRAEPHNFISSLAKLIGIKILDNPRVTEKIEILEKNRDFYHDLVLRIFPLLPKIYEINNGSFIKYLILILLEKIFAFSSKKELATFLQKTPDFPSFLSKISSGNDLMKLAFFLLIVDSSLQKTDLFLAFLREGIVDFLEKLAESPESCDFQVFPLFRAQKPVANPGTYANYGLFSKELPTFDKNLQAPPQNLEEEELFEEKNPFETRFLLQNIQKEHIETEETLKEIEQALTSQTTEKNKYLELFQKFKKTKEKIQQTADLLQKSQKKSDQALPKSEKKDVSEETQEKVKEIKQELSKIAKNLLIFVKNSKEFKSLDLSSTEEIMSSLKEIQNSLKLNVCNEQDFGLRAFEIFSKMLDKYKTFTLYELKNSNIIKSLLDFLTDGTLRKLKTATKAENLELFEEEVKKDAEDPQEIQLSQQQISCILRRIFLFLCTFLKKSPLNPQTNIFHDFLRNLQDLFLEFNRFTTKLEFNEINQEISLIQDLRSLSQRNRFKIRYIESERPKEATEEERELFDNKERIFKEIPSLMLAVELFGTFEVIEDYLLNKLNGKEDLHLRPQPHRHNYFNYEKLAKYKKPNPEEDPGFFDEEEDFEDKMDPFLEFLKESKQGATKNLEKTEQIPEKSAIIRKKSADEPYKIEKKNTNPLPKPTANPFSPANEFERIFESKLQHALSHKDVHSEKKPKRTIDYKKHFEILFFVNGKPVSKYSTIYEICNKNLTFPTTFNYDNSFVVDYKLALKRHKKDEFKEKKAFSSSFCANPRQTLVEIVKKLNAVLTKLPEKCGQDLENVEAFASVYQMLILLHEIKRLCPLLLSSKSIFYPFLLGLKQIPAISKVFSEVFEENRAFELEHESFISLKLSQFLNKRFCDPLVIASNAVDAFFKEMCVCSPFMIDLKCRLHFFKNFTFDVSRSLYYLCQMYKNKSKDLESLKIGKLHKKKVKVSRDNLIENGFTIFDYYAHKRSILEFEFLNEEGTGLGPTLEYFALLAQEIKKVGNSLKIWRKTDDETLFPAPLNPMAMKPQDLQKVQIIFKLLGMLVARAILDERLLDLPLNTLFWDLLLENPIHLEDLKKMDRQLYGTMSIFQEIANKKREIENEQTFSLKQRKELIERITFNGAALETLGIYFTFPGYEHINLVPNGNEKSINIDNLQEFLDAFAGKFFKDCVKLQVEAFRDGFNKVFPLNHLKCFEGEEFESLYCGSMKNEYWETKELFENIIATYGYSNKNQSFLNFVDILNEFSPEERKHFLKFVTGCPRLPKGGFKNLNPRLTVVKKTPNLSLPGQTADHMLPSVMTCQNYVKLPDYSSKEMMRQRLKYAMKEGQNEFTLS